jgi:hypothetical protein
MNLLAYRVGAQGLARRQADTLGVLRSWTIQDSPPGAAATAIAARAETVQLDEALAQRAAVAMYNPRTATAVVPADEAAAFGTAFLPPGDAECRAMIGQALPGREEGFEEPVALAVEAISDALDGRELSRDDLHEELRGRLPGELLPWCPGCGSHHARRGLLVMAGLHGRLCVSGRAGRQPAFARTDQWTAWEAPPREEAAAELVRRFRAAYGPVADGDFAAWAGIATAHARALYELAGDAPSPGRTLQATGVRLLAAGDPLLLARDREVLALEKELRAQLFRPAGAPGLVLADGVPAGLWRAKKARRQLSVTVEAFGDVERDALEAEAQRLAPLRGCETAAVDWG